MFNAKILKSEPFIIALVFSLAFIVIHMLWLFQLTAPSDPLQYVGPALMPGDGFDFLDRIGLWLWLRFFKILPIPSECVGGIATLAQTTLTLGLGVWWLCKEYGKWAGTFFGCIYSMSLMAVTIATYTYPMQLMTLVLLVTVILMHACKEEYKFFISGVGLGIALFCKVQAFSFGFFILIAILFEQNTFKKKVLDMLRVGLGIVIGVASLFLILCMLDGYEKTQNMIYKFFLGGVSEQQFKGRAAGNIPPFYSYLKDPTCVMALFGFFTPFLLRIKSSARDFAMIGLFQTLGLLLVYIVTKRGGPLIHNYSYDAFVFGALAFSVSFAHLFSKSSMAKQLHSFYGIGAFFVASTMAIIWISIGYSGAKAYFPREGFYYALGVLLIALIVFIILLKGLGKTIFNFRILINLVLTALIFVWMFGYSRKAVSEVFDKMAFSNPYHALSRALAKEGTGRKIWLMSKVNRNDIEDGSFRIKTTFQFLYTEEPDAKMVIVGGEEPFFAELLMTDSPELISKLAKKPMTVPESSVYLFDLNKETYKLVKY